MSSSLSWKAAAALAATIFLSSNLYAQETVTFDDEERPPLDRVLQDEFAYNDLWYDGQAEVNEYEAVTYKYGEPREHEVRMVVVTEDFNKEYYAKADWPYGQKPLLPVMKQHYTTVVPTEKYDFHYAVSTFSDREDFGHTVKASFSIFELCGMTSKQFHFWKDPVVEVYQSYWDGEGTGERTVSMDRNTFLEEELSLVLRAYPFTAGNAGSAHLRLLSSEFTSHARKPSISRAVATRSEREESYEIAIEVADGRRLTYRFAKEYPHVMKEFRHSDGRHWKLTETYRDAYWE